MNLTKIRLTGQTVIDFPITEASPTHQFILKDVTGLGPPDIGVRMANKVISGTRYQGRRPSGRDIVIKVELNPDYTLNQNASDLRSILYGLLNGGISEKPVTISLMDGPTVLAITEGYVDKMDVVPFTDKPMVQITLLCPETYFMTPVTYPFYWTSPYEPVLVNSGNAPSGFEAELTLTAVAVAWFMIDTNNPKNYIGFTRQFASGDKIKFNTQEGYRTATITRSGITTSLLPYMNADSDWPQLSPGSNTFYTSATLYPSTSYTWNYIRYRAKSWGV